MDTMLLYALIAGALIAVGVLVFALTRRKPHAEPPPATRHSGNEQSAGQPASAAPAKTASEHAYHTPHAGGIEVDELYVDEDDRLSTNERHIGDTQPVDRSSLRFPEAPPREPSNADGGKTVAKADGGSSKRR